MLPAKFDATMPARVVIRFTRQLVPLFTIILAATASPWNESRIVPSELQALQDLHSYFCNSSSKDTRMNSSSRTWSLDVDPCGSGRKWLGVVCVEALVDPSRLVVASLSLRGMGIPSPKTPAYPTSTRIFPPSVAHLTSLTALDLSNTALSGVLPAWLANLKELKRLLLSNNLITSVASEVAAVTSLQILDLSYNELGLNPPLGPAAFPNTLGNLSSLKLLNLSHNGLQSPVPSAIAYMRSLVQLDLSHNFFTAPLPDWMGDLPNLQLLEVQHNSFEGPLPSWLAAIPVAFLADNNFCSDIISQSCRTDHGVLIGAVVAASFVTVPLLCLAMSLWHLCRRWRYRTNENEVAMTMVAPEEQRVTADAGVRMRDAKEFWRGEGGGVPKVAVFMEGRLIAVASEVRRGGRGRAGESDSCGETSDEEGPMRT